MGDKISKVSFKKTLLMLGAALAVCGGAQAQSFHVLYHFNGSDGFQPTAPLVFDGAGNLYGSTERGGTTGIGTVFRLATGRTESVLHSFTSGSGDGAMPLDGLAIDGAGNLYGTVSSAGANDGGALFKVAPDGSESLLHSFAYYRDGGSDGSEPGTRPLVGADGNLYGTTPGGGSYAEHCTPFGCGTIYRVTPDGTETVLHTFDYDDGTWPMGELVTDGAGNLYGTTKSGGSGGGGTVFELAPDGALTTLHAFTLSGKHKDGIAGPSYGLVRDASGNLYGVSRFSSDLHNKHCPSQSCGAIFMLTAQGKLRLLHEFTGGADGSVPSATMVMDAGGSLYGTTLNGGGSGCKHMGCGTVFRYSPDGSMAILHAFSDREGSPNGVTFGPDGALYGAAFSYDDQSRGGILFRLDP